MIALDTMVLIWGLRDRDKPAPDAATEEQRIRSRITLQELSDQRDLRVIVPAVVVAELLVPVPLSEHGQFIAKLQARFFCPPFDIRAASLAARLWQLHKGLPESEKYDQRKLLKADVQIIATAKAAGATAIYSHDAKLRRLASEVMAAHELIARHSDMFVDKEIREGRL